MLKISTASQYPHLPVALVRFKRHASQWRYRWGVQAGNEAGDRLRRSTSKQQASRPRKGPIMANQQAAVTVTGFVAGDPTLGGTESFRVLTFRMGSTRSRLNPTTRQWEDYGTL